MIPTTKQQIKVKRNDLKKIISVTSCHLWFSNNNYYERTSELTKIILFLSEKMVTQILLARM